MKVVFTAEALRDLDDILSFMAVEHPSARRPFETRLRASLRRIGDWPHSAQGVIQRPGVRMVPLVRYPFNIFYQVTDRVDEILHIHHAKRTAG